jgi:hypothetical protein
MITKLILTLLVVTGAILFVRMRAGKRLTSQLPPPATPVKSPRSRVFLFTAVVLLLLTLAGTGYYLFHLWQDSYREVTVRVINANTGQITSYQAYKGDVDRERGLFRTVEGLEVTLSDVERLETGAE